jgi:hypothetical protein
MAAIRQCALLLALVIGSGCASHRATTTSGPERWSGSFKQAGGSAVIGGELTRARSSAYGTITLTPVTDQRGRVKVDLSVTTSVSGSQIAWAVFEGPCNAPSPPVIQVNEFPTIEIGSSGSGIVRTELAMTMNSHASYHANVYWTGRATDVTNVMLCANLAFSGTR